MISSTKASFRRRFDRLPPRVQQHAIASYRLWQCDPWNPTLMFKKIGNYWSVRIDGGYRAMATRESERVTWFWIGSHDEYERLIKELRRHG